MFEVEKRNHDSTLMKKAEMESLLDQLLLEKESLTGTHKELVKHHEQALLEWEHTRNALQVKEESLAVTEEEKQQLREQISMGLQEIEEVHRKLTGNLKEKEILADNLMKARNALEEKETALMQQFEHRMLQLRDNIHRQELQNLEKEKNIKKLEIRVADVQQHLSVESKKKRMVQKKVHELDMQLIDAQNQRDTLEQQLSQERICAGRTKVLYDITKKELEKTRELLIQMSMKRKFSSQVSQGEVGQPVMKSHQTESDPDDAIFKCRKVKIHGEDKKKERDASHPETELGLLKADPGRKDFPLLSKCTEEDLQIHEDAEGVENWNTDANTEFDKEGENTT
ncbi:unnamed protein product [Darwinula stevensoni]|uniref:Uncharacterized protein n=1 Tax=Darwinula stevensoni TaxID=69355 RepID=A0A7R8X5C2_9CRUS|nr:unnamed protein product [Darwinula stevensoni]CAG0878557.1 unnamed protein product [Darwinula stevensoni]